MGYHSEYSAYAYEAEARGLTRTPASANDNIPGRVPHVYSTDHTPREFLQYLVWALDLLRWSLR
jgi:hypothetical protein